MIIHGDLGFTENPCLASPLRCKIDISEMEMKMEVAKLKYFGYLIL